MWLSDVFNAYYQLLHIVGHKKTRHFYFSIALRQILTDFRNFFTAIYKNELWNKNLLQFSPHLKSVAALPCET